MGEQSMIIIGAGLAGLSTGCYAQMNGYDSMIFEHHTKAGGVAAAWRRGDYLIDGGIHFLICHKPGTPIYDVYSEICDIEKCACEDMTTYLRFHDEDGKEIISITDDLQKFEHDLIAISPDDIKEIQGFINEVRSLMNSHLLTDLGMSTAPPELRGRFDSLKEMWQMRSFMKYFMGKYSKKAATYSKNFQSPTLQTVFKYMFSPDIATWFVIMILASVAGGMLGLIKNGCQEFVQLIEDRYRSLGGEIKFRSKAEKIIVENNEAVGIITSDGTEHRADVIVSAADGRSTIFEMLDGKYVDEKIIKRYQNWKPFDPAIVVSLGVARTFENDAPLSYFLLDEPLIIGERETGLLPLRVFNYGDAFAPPDKSVIQVMIETDWEYWSELRKNHERYNQEKQEVANEIIARLEKFYPGITEQIEMTDVATPYTSWRYTLNDKGSPMGWQLTKSSIMELIPRTLPELNNFYMAGQWVLPGGGVPGCIYTGRNVVQILCKKNGTKFRSNYSETHS